VDSFSIVLADDHVLFRQGMKRLIEEVPGLAVIGEASDGLELLNLLTNVTADLIVLDISMEGLQGIDASREIRRLYPQTKILILTMHKNKEYVCHAMSAGASGYLLKEESDEELFTAIEAIRRGETYVSRRITGTFAGDLCSRPQGKEPAASEPLTSREREIVKLIAGGKSNSAIASVLHISIRTVENHRANIMKKLDLKKTADLVRYAIQRGVV
jgi:DNA-binding NarL/FixJ family response regulator